MGSESYFIKIEPHESKKIEYKKIIECLQRKYYLQFVDSCTDNFYNIIVNDYVKINIDIQGVYINNISLEACFSWFEDSLDFCYKFIKDINDLIQIKIIDYSDHRINFTNENNFKIEIKKMNDEKYDEFIQKYGIINSKILPDSNFYKFVRKKNRFKMLKKLFRKNF